MTIYAIGDLHLPGHAEKPMNIFGDHWDRHFDTIREDWLRKVGPEDAVLIPGDVSWAMRLEDARDDLNDVAALPGIKLLLRGNHDYWWNSIGKVRSMLGENMYALQNDALRLGDVVFCGTRGWNVPGAQGADAQDEKIYQRELLRLEMSLRAAEKLGDFPIVVMTHYPPLYKDTLSTGFTEILESHPSVRAAVYGHLHGVGAKVAFEGVKKGIRYHLVSCDALRFSLKEISLEEKS